MAEDIDIEEHDLLQNPTIQRIFPDLSILKQEIMDFDEGLSVKEGKCKETGRNLSTDFAQPFHQKNIPGSKPSKETKTLRSELKVKLINIRTYLAKTKRFCDQCLILFPSKVSLWDHELSVHRTVENSSKQGDPMYPDNRKQHKCSLCDGEFTTKYGLKRHKGQIHNIDQRCYKQTTVVKSLITKDVFEDKQFDLETNYIFRKACFHCDEQFSNQQDLIDHLYSILYAKKGHDPTMNIEYKDLTHAERPINNNTEILQNNINQCPDVGKGRKRKVSESKNIYSCPICSYYFNEEIFCKSHAIVKHKALKNIQLDKSSFNPMCKFCDLRHHDMLAYNSHLRKIHKNEMSKPVNSVLPSNSNGLRKCFNNVLLPEDSFVDITPKHRCLSILEQNSEVQDDDKLIYSDIQVMVSKVILFECSECNVLFLTSDAASKHLKHLGLKKTWECRNCHRLFKDKDAKIHQKQHLYSKYFKIVKVIAEVQPTVLYKCPMCAVHFGKDKISQHCSICEFLPRSANSSYCKVCDIFIELSIKASHENDHTLRKLSSCDIKIVDSETPVIINDKNCNKTCVEDPHTEEKFHGPDPITIDVGNTTTIKDDNECRNLRKISKNIFGVSAKKQLTYNFCNICKCNISRVFKTDIHRKSLCVNIVKYICKYCGLMFSNKSFTSHKKLHQQYKTLKLQDLTFYNLHTNKVMKPLIPEYPKCELCEKHFISKVEIKGHLCDINDYFICSICKTKFSETAYKLHTPFHSYSFVKSKCTKKYIHTIKSCHDRNAIDKSIPSMTKDEIIPLIYTCKNCNVSLTTYDEVVEHCHSHTNLNKVEVNGIECTICQLKFADPSYIKHVELHKDFENIKLTCINFDVLHFGTDKWLKLMYKSLSKNEINKIIGDSIYKYETRIKMEVIQEGPSNLTIYKCDKCQLFIDCNGIYSHIVTCCPNSEISFCTFCDLAFACSYTRNNHEKIHAIPDITVKSYRIVVFNREQDRNVNYNISKFEKCHVLYECRYCHVLVDKYDYIYHICFSKISKKCDVCGLIIYAENLDDHILKHKLVPSFNVNKIKVVLLGNKTDEDNILHSNNDLLPTFNGIVCDYTFYKCTDCEVCVRDVRNTVQHFCLVEAAKSQCIKCDLIFDEGKLKGHLKLHDTDPDITKETIFVQPFSNRKPSKNIDKPKKLLAVKVEKNSKNSNENFNHRIAKLYKCSCGLHFVQQASLQDHMKKCSGKNKSKKGIQNCSKCGLIFTSDVLFKHLLEHHGDKNVVFGYDIVENSREG